MTMKSSVKQLFSAAALVAVFMAGPALSQDTETKTKTEADTPPAVIKFADFHGIKD